MRLSYFLFCSKCVTNDGRVLNMTDANLAQESCVSGTTSSSGCTPVRQTSRPGGSIDGGGTLAEAGCGDSCCVSATKQSAAAPLPSPSPSPSTSPPPSTSTSSSHSCWVSCPPSASSPPSPRGPLPAPSRCVCVYVCVCVATSSLRSIVSASISARPCGRSPNSRRTRARCAAPEDEQAIDEACADNGGARADGERGSSAAR